MLIFKHKPYRIYIKAISILLVFCLFILNANYAYSFENTKSTLRVPMKGGERVKDSRSLDVENTQTAERILKVIKNDVENIRNPNKLCGWIIYFITNPNCDPYKILEIILEEIGQNQYLDTYKEVMKIKLEKIAGNKDLSVSSSIITADDWQVIDTRGVENELGALQPLDELQQIPIEEVELSDLGHGIMSEHRPGELDNLKDATKFINEFVREKKKMGTMEILYPITIDGKEILPQKGDVIVTIEDVIFTIRPFKEKIVITSNNRNKIGLFFEKFSSILGGFNGICTLDNKQFRFLVDADRSEIILKPMHEILELHNMISRNLQVRTWTDIRRNANRGVYRIDNAYRDYLFYPKPSDIPQLMDEYFEWLKNEEEKIELDAQDKMHPIELASHAFYKLLCIHPFENGNTRTSSMVMNYILMKNGFPPFILNETNDNEFFTMERFIYIPILIKDLMGKDFGIGAIVDTDKILSFNSRQFTAFLVHQIKKILEEKLRFSTKEDRISI